MDSRTDIRKIVIQKLEPNNEEHHDFPQVVQILRALYQSQGQARKVPIFWLANVIIEINIERDCRLGGVYIEPGSLNRWFPTLTTQIVQQLASTAYKFASRMV